MNDSLRIGLDLSLAPSQAFDLVLDELALALADAGIRFEPGPGGRVTEGEVVVGEVVAWEPGQRLVLRWYPATWDRNETTEMELNVAATPTGAAVTFEHRGWSRIVGGPGELAGWMAGQVVAPIVHAASPNAFGDWLTDRRARRPSGAESRATYGDPLYHYPNFRVILDELALTPADSLLEVGCGGGALLKTALASGCRAAAIDHSADMVRLARQVNAQAVAEGRLEVAADDGDLREARRPRQPLEAAPRSLPRRPAAAPASSSATVERGLWPIALRSASSSGVTR